MSMDACGIVRALKNVVCGGIVKIGKADQNIRRKIAIALLIAKILGLLHTKIVRYLLLRHVVILTQVPQSPIMCHKIT